MLTLNGIPTRIFGDVIVEGDLINGTDVMYPGKCVIKTIGIAGSGLDFNYASAANNTEQQLDLGAILPAGCVVVSVVLECDETVAGSGSAVVSLDAGISGGSAELLTAASTDSDGDTNISAATSSPVLAHSTSARNVFLNATPTAFWDTLTAGEWSVIVRYDDLGSVRTQKGI